jgi:uncharacterized membrane protein YbhN (UPF0104 family)
MSLRAKQVRNLVGWLIGLIGAVVIAVWVLPRVASYSEMAATIKALSAWELLGLFGLGFLTIAAAGWATKLTLPGLTWGKGTMSTLCANFLTALVPTGVDLAVRFAMYKSWGFGARQSASAVALAGLSRYVTLLSLPLLGTAAILISGRGDEQTPIRLVVGSVVFILLVSIPWLLLRHKNLARRIAVRLQRCVHLLARIVRRPAPPRVAEWLLKTHEQIAAQARDRWPSVTLSQLVATLMNAVVLLAAIRFVGLGPDLLSWTEVLYAFALGTIAAIIPLTPGNIGVTELILLGVLGLSTVNMESQILAAALLYRIFTWMLPIPLGIASYLIWRYSSRSRAAK